MPDAHPLTFPCSLTSANPNQLRTIVGRHPESASTSSISRRVFFSRCFNLYDANVSAGRTPESAAAAPTVRAWTSCVGETTGRREPSGGLSERLAINAIGLNERPRGGERERGELRFDPELGERERGRALPSRGETQRAPSQLRTVLNADAGRTGELSRCWLDFTSFGWVMRIVAAVSRRRAPPMA